MISSQPLFADRCRRWQLERWLAVVWQFLRKLAAARSSRGVVRPILRRAAEIAARPGWFAATGRQLSKQNVRASYEVLSTVKTRTTSEC
jgi:hypothetical protein